MQLYPPLNPLPRGDFSIPLLGGVRGIRVKLSDWGGWHGQTLFVRAFLATHNGTKVTGGVADHCPPPAGGRGGGPGQVRILGYLQPEYLCICFENNTLFHLW